MRRTPLKKQSKGQAQKQKIWRAVVAACVWRAKGRCEKCGNLPDWRGLQGHHIMPRSKGGVYAPENCLIVCANCHEALTNPGSELSNKT